MTNFKNFENLIEEVTGVKVVVLPVEELIVEDDFDAIIKVVSDTLNVPVSRIKSGSRKQEIVDARHIIAGLTQKYFPAYYTSRQGRKLGGRDHSTILNSRKRYNDLIFSNEAFQRKAAACQRRLHAKVKFPNKQRCEPADEYDYTGVQGFQNLVQRLVPCSF